MSERIAFRYEGRAVSKANFRWSPRNAASRKQWKRIKAFESEIGWLAKAAGARCSDRPAALYVIAINQRPDLDNLSKATIDALRGVAFHDDSQKYLIGVHIAAAKKLTEPPGLEVTIRYSEEES